MSLRKWTPHETPDFFITLSLIIPILKYMAPCKIAASRRAPTVSAFSQVCNGIKASKKEVYRIPLYL